MKALIDEAKQYIQREVQSKNDVFIKLCSLNLLNAAIKDKEYKKELSYGYIKPRVSRLVKFLISHFENGYADELYYDAPIEWDGVRLQPISKDLFLLAKDIHSRNIDVNQINEVFKHIIEDK